MNSLVKLVLVNLMFCFCSTVFAFGKQNYDAFMGFMNTGKCDEAEQLVDKFFKKDELFFFLGAISQYCRKDKSKAIQYYKTVIRMNGKDSDSAIRALIELGETPPEPTNNYGAASNPPQKPPQIIIQQQQAPVIMGNPAACIQDGGSTYCPNHPNTVIKPFKF